MEKTPKQLKRAIYNKKYYRKNRAHLLEQSKKWRAIPENRKTVTERSAAWRNENREHYREYQREYARMRRKTGTKQQIEKARAYNRDWARNNRREKKEND